MATLTSQDWQQLMAPVLQVAGDVPGDAETTMLEQEQHWGHEQRDDEAHIDLDTSQQCENEAQHVPPYEGGMK